MKSYLLICSVFILLSSFGCKKPVCESCKVGSVDLSEEAIEFLTYENGDTLNFQNTTDDQLIFEVEVIDEPYEICTKYLCELTTGPFESIPCEYYAAMGIRHVLKQTNHTDPESAIWINMSVSTSSYQSESTLFYDLFIVTMSAVGSLARGESIAHVHFSDPVLIPSQTEISEPFLSADSFEINDKTYENILLSMDSQNMIYYQVNEGIKVIKLDGIFYEYVD